MTLVIDLEKGDSKKKWSKLTQNKKENILRTSRSGVDESATTIALGVIRTSPTNLLRCAVINRRRYLDIHETSSLGPVDAIVEETS